MSIGCKPLNEVEVSKMMESLERERDACLFLLGVKTGFRISELLSIKVNDCMQYGAVKSVLTVERKHVKGKGSSRSIPLNPEVSSALGAYIETLPKEQVYLFQSQKGNPLSRIQAWRIISGAAIDNKIKGKVATHSMRKSYCKRIYEASGKDLVATQKAMGHTSVQSTISYLNFYTNEDINELILKATK